MELSEIYELYLKHKTVTTDSRDCPEGSIFFALRGDNFDGNAYASKALEQGCAYAVVDEEQYAVKGDPRYILVKNSLDTMQQLAHLHRVTLGLPVIQITGTNGKTTTKELVSAVLEKKYKTLHTEGNLNNHIGVPKTLLRLTGKHQVAVIETGANHPGEIALLSKITDPDFGIITNVGRAHLEGFGSFEGVVRTKCELYDYLRAKKNTTVFLNGDSDILQRMSEGLETVSYGTQPGKDLAVEGNVIDCTPYLSFRWREKGKEWQYVTTRMIGSYNISNLLAAIAVGLKFNVPVADINSALAGYVPSNNRSQLVKTVRNTLIVDAYNANPTSMMAALENFARMHADNKMVILGQMNELGKESVEEHRKVVDFLDKAGFGEVWLVGENFSGIAPQFRTFENEAEVENAIKAGDISGRTILIKGSNSNKLYKLADIL